MREALGLGDEAKDPKAAALKRKSKAVKRNKAMEGRLEGGRVKDPTLKRVYTSKRPRR